MKEIFVFADADVEAKAKACQEATDHILAYAKSKGLEQKLLESLVASCVTSVSIEAYTRDCASDQARDEIYRDAMGELAAILGMQMQMIEYAPGGVN